MRSTMAASSSVCSEERNLRRIREWERRNREWLEKEPKDEPSPFEKPRRATSIDALSRFAQTLLGNFEDPNGPPVRFEDYDPSSYPRGRPAHTYTEKPPFQSQYLHQNRLSFSSSTSSSARSLSSSRSPQSVKKLPVLELFGPASKELRPYLGQDHDSSQQKKSQNPGDIRVSAGLPPPTMSAFSPPVAPLSRLHSSHSELLHTDDKDTPERHHGTPGNTVKPSSLDLPRDAAPPQPNEGNALPSQTFPPPLASKPPNLVMPQKPTAPEAHGLRQAHFVDDILKEMTYSWPPLLTAVQPSKFAFPAKEAQYVPPAYPGQKLYGSTPTASQQTSSCRGAAAHSGEAPPPLIRSSPAVKAEGPTVTNWQLNNWLRGSQQNPRTESQGKAPLHSHTPAPKQPPGRELAGETGTNRTVPQNGLKKPTGVPPSSLALQLSCKQGGSSAMASKPVVSPCKVLPMKMELGLLSRVPKKSKPSQEGQNKAKRQPPPEKMDFSLAAPTPTKVRKKKLVDGEIKAPPKKTLKLDKEVKIPSSSSLLSAAADDAPSISVIHGAPKAKEERKKRAKKPALLLPLTLQEPPTPMDIGKVPLKRRAEEGSGLAPISKDHAAKRIKISPVPQERPKTRKSDEVSKAFSFLDAAMSFVERGIAMETDPQTPKLAYTMYAEALFLIRFILKLKNLTDPSASAKERDITVLCMKCQSLLQMAMFRLYYFETPIDHFKSFSKAQELAPKGSGVLSDLDSALGPLHLSSSMAFLVRYVRQGLHWLRLDTQAPL